MEKKVRLSPENAQGNEYEQRDRALTKRDFVVLKRRTDELDGVTVTLETLIQQNAEQILLRATKVEVGEIEGRVTTNEASISVMAGEILLKATQSDLDTLSGRVTTAESSISVMAGEIALKASQSSVDSLGNRMTTAETSIIQNANAIALKASQSDLNSLGNRVTTAESTLTVQAGQIATKVSTTDLNNTLTNYSTISQTANAISLQFNSVAEQTRMNGVEIFPQGWRNRAAGWANPLNVGSTIPTSDWGINDGLFMLRLGGVQFARSIYIPHVAGSSYHITLRNTYFENAGGTFYVGLEFYTDIDVSSGSNYNTIYAIQMTPTVGTHGLLQGTINSSQYNTAQNSSRYVRVRILTYWGSSLTGATLIRDISVKRLGTPTQMQGAKYVFDGDYATFTNGGLRIQNNAGTTVFDADTNGNLRITGQITATSGSFTGTINASSGSFTGTVNSTSGSIGNWTIGNNSLYNGNMYIHATNQRIYFNGLSGNRDLYYDGTYITTSNAFRAIGTIRSSGAVAPWSDNAVSCGIAGTRWTTVWAVTSTIQTSDIRTKTDIKDIENGVDFILSLEPRQYKLIDGQSGRKHFGFIAQEVEQVIKSTGIEDVAVYVDPEVNPSKEDIEGMTEETALYKGLRYEEFIAPMVQTIQYLNRKIERLEAIINERAL